MNLTKKNKILYLVTLILVVGGDLFTKHLVSSSMLLGQSHEIINNFFYFTYAHNTGVAWGMFAGKLGLFIVVAIIAAVVMIVFFSDHQETTCFLINSMNDSRPVNTIDS